MRSEYFVSINGEIYNGEEAKISVFDRGFLYGDSVYESTRTFNAKPFRLEAHLQRLFESAKKMDLTITFTKKEIEEKIQELISFSQLSDATLRIILTRGDNNDLDLDPSAAHENNLIIMSKKITALSPLLYQEGVHVGFYQKKNVVFGPLPKSGNYQENILAKKTALAQNLFDCLMVNSKNQITEASTSNVWIIKNETLYTPPLSDGLLDGLTRKTLLQMGARGLLPFKIIEKSLTKEDLLHCDECFLSSTVRCILPVSKIDNVEISGGKAGKNTLHIMQTYNEFVR